MPRDIDIPFRTRCVRRQGCHPYFAQSDISNDDKMRIFKRGPTGLMFE
jgi:hypothetical protein